MGLKREGRRDRRHVSGARRADVVAKVRELEQQRDAGLAGAAGRPATVGAWLEHWLETIAARKVRASTLEGYRSKVNHRIVPALGHHRLDRLQPEHVEAFYGELLDGGLSSSTVLQVHRILLRAFKVAVQRGRVGRNVCTLVDAPSLERAGVEPLTAAEARALLAAAEGLRNGARWSVALALGLRQGEALGLRWDDLDLGAGTVRVRRALQRQKDQGLTRGAARGRERLARAWPRVRAADGPADRPGRGLEGVDGVAARRRGARRTTARRATHRGDAAAAAGVPARVAMQVLGHSQIGLTLGTYSHVVPELAQEAASRMAAALWSEPAAAPEATTLAPRRPRRDAQ
jgi:integrase